MSCSQPQFRLYKLPLGSENFNNFQLFNDEDVEVIGTQMPQNVEGEEDTPIKWQDYEIKTLKVIQNKMKEEFTKFARE